MCKHIKFDNMLTYTLNTLLKCRQYLNVASLHSICVGRSEKRFIF